MLGITTIKFNRPCSCLHQNGIELELNNAQNTAQNNLIFFYEFSCNLKQAMMTLQGMADHRFTGVSLWDFYIRPNPDGRKNRKPDGRKKESGTLKRIRTTE